MKSNTTIPYYMTIPEVAEELRLSVRTVRTLISAGKIATIRVSTRKLVIDPRDLDVYTKSRRRPRKRSRSRARRS
jgi:excisionase family DNA binding protein